MSGRGDFRVRSEKMFGRAAAQIQAPVGNDGDTLEATGRPRVSDDDRGGERINAREIDAERQSY